MRFKTYTDFHVPGKLIKGIRKINIEFFPGIIAVIVLLTGLVMRANLPHNFLTDVIWITLSFLSLFVFQARIPDNNYMMGRGEYLWKTLFFVILHKLRCRVYSCVVRNESTNGGDVK